MRNINIIEMVFFVVVAFCVAMWGNPFDYLRKLFKKNKSTNRCFYSFIERPIGEVIEGSTLLEFSRNRNIFYKVISSRKIYFGKNKGYYKTIVEPIK